MRLNTWFLGLTLFTGCMEYNYSDVLDEVPDIEIEPPVVTFGTLDAYSGYAEEEVTVRNVGIADLRVSSITQEFNDINFTVSALGDDVLAPGEETTFVVGYDPVGFGSDTDIIHLWSNDPDEDPADVVIHGRGSGPMIIISPEEYEFSGVALGCDDGLEVTISNVGDLDLEVTALRFFAAQPTDLFFDDNGLSNGSLPWLLGPGTSMTVYVAYNPIDLLDDYGVIEVDSTDPVRPTVDAEQTAVDVSHTVVSEVFEQEEEDNEADFLFVIDDSCSMSDEQANLAANMPVFIDILDAAGVDYQIGVVTTGQSSLQGPVITPLLADPRTEFSSQVQVGTGGSGTEMGLLMGDMALAGTFGPYLRTDAPLTVIYVSDERDWSTGYSDPNYWVPYRDSLLSLKASADDVHAHAIAGDYPSGCGGADAEFGDGYYDVVNSLGGSFVSICAADWAASITTLAEASLLERVFPLVNPAVEGSVSVWVDGAEETTGWIYDSSQQAVVFDFDSIPDSGSEIVIEYTVLEACPN